MKTRLFAPRHVFSSSSYQVPRRSFASTVPRAVKNRVYTSIRSHDEFNSLLLLSASSRTPLLTFWTASWCPSCRAVKPIVKEAVENGVGEEQGGVGFAEVELDAPGMGDLGMRYFINSMPSLLSFSRQEAQLKTMITSVDEMKDREFLRMWIEDEARRGGQGGAGGGSGLFGGLFGVGK